MEKEDNFEVIELQFHDKQEHKAFALTEKGLDFFEKMVNDFENRIAKLEEDLKHG